MRIVLALSLSLLAACSRESKDKPAAAPATPAPATAAAPPSELDAGSLVALASDSGSAAELVATLDVDAGPPPEFLGVIRGVVKLAKGAPLPIALVPKMSNGQVEAISVDPCPPLDFSDRQTVKRAAKGGGISPVHVALTGMSAAPKRAPITHDLFIDACRLRPTLVGAMRGDTIRITNRGVMPMLPVLPGDSFMKGMLRGESREFPLNTKGSLAIGCNMGNYCGESTVVSLTHALAAVTDDEGHFEITQVPLDQALQVHAWHPLFEVSTAPLKLTKAQPEKTIELLVTPTAAALATLAHEVEAKKKPAVAAKGAAKPAAKPADDKANAPKQP